MYLGLMKKSLAVVLVFLTILCSTYVYMRLLTQEKGISLSKTVVDVSSNMQADVRAQEFERLDKVALRIRTEQRIVLVILALSVTAATVLLVKPYISKN